MTTTAIAIPVPSGDCAGSGDGDGSDESLYDGEIVVSIAETPLDTAPSGSLAFMCGIMSSVIIRCASASVRWLSKP